MLLYATTVKQEIKYRKSLEENLPKLTSFLTTNNDMFD